MQETNFAWFDDIIEPVFHGDPEAPHYVCAAYTLQELIALIGFHPGYPPNFSELNCWYFGRALLSLLDAGLLTPATVNAQLNSYYAKNTP